MKLKTETVSHSVVSDSLRPRGQSMKFSRPEYLSGLPFPSPEHLPYPEMEHRSATLQADSLLADPNDGTRREREWKSKVGQIERKRTRKCKREPQSFGSALYIYIFFLPLAPPVLCKLGYPGVLFVLPEVLTLILRPSFILFSQAFLFLVF